MIFARLCYFLTAALGFALVILTLAGPFWLWGGAFSAENCLGVLGALVVFAISISRTRTTRVIVGILYGLAALQITSFALIAVSGVPGSGTQYLLFLLAGLTLDSMSAIYFLYSPLERFLSSRKA